MSKSKLLIATSLISALIAAPAFAAKDKDDDKRDDWGPYRENMQQRHQMNMDAMQMMIDTMTILRDMNHQPGADEKKKLSDMIKQMNDMMARQKDMNEKAMKYMDDGKGRHMMDGPRRDMR
jgi:hypothetical protein